MVWNAQKQRVAVFSWDKIVGFEVLGPAQDQVFTDMLLHEEEVILNEIKALIAGQAE